MAQQEELTHLVSSPLACVWSFLREPLGGLKFCKPSVPGH